MQIAGVPICYSMPDTISIGLGGGSLVRRLADGVSSAVYRSVVLGFLLPGPNISLVFVQLLLHFVNTLLDHRCGFFLFLL